MNASGASKVLPIILTALTLATAVFFYKQRQVLRQKTQELLSQSAKPTPSTIPATKNPIVIPTTSTPLSVNSVEESSRSLEPRGKYPGRRNTPHTRDDTGKPQRLSNTGSKTTTVCTPVYGMANTCAEHAVVDTALDTSIFYNLAGMSYIFGLAAFIKSKRA